MTENATSFQQRRRSIATRTGVLLAAMTILTGTAATSVALGAGSGPSGRLLQAVHISLGSDGSVRSISGTNFTVNGGDVSSSDSSYSPASEASKLPVAVTLGYIYKGRSGTNLADIKGKSGTVEVDVTVTNTTVHTERISAGAQSTYSLISAPVTVAASAVVPGGSVTNLKAPSSGTSPGGAQTTGVIQTEQGGDASVQWQAILAPPVLSSVTTFRLVEQTSSFAIPKIKLSAQPGIVTDPSAAQVIDTELGSGQAGSSANKLVQLETQTIDLVFQVQERINSATQDLVKLRRNLKTQSRDLGAQLVSQIKSSKSRLQGSSQQLSTTLSSLSTSLSDRLGRGALTVKQRLKQVRSTINRQIIGSVNADDTSIPRTTVPPTGTTTTICPVQLWSPSSATPTLIEQLNAIIKQAESIDSGTSVGCANTIKDSLDADIASLISELDATKDALGTLSSEISATADSIGGASPTTAISNVGSSVTSLAEAIKLIRNDVATLLPTAASGPVATTLTDLDALKVDLTTAIADATSLETAVAGVHTTAATASGAGGRAGSIEQAFSDLEDLICAPDEVTALSSAPSTADDLSTLIIGGPCGSTPAEGSYVDLAKKNNADWQSVSDATGDPGLGADTSALKVALGAISTSLDALRSDVAGGAMSIDAGVQGILDKVDGLCSSVCDPSTSSGSLHNLATDLTDLEDAYATVLSNAKTHLQGLATDAATAQSQVQSASRDASSAKTATDQHITTGFSELTAAVALLAGDLNTTSKNSIRGEKLFLTESVRATSREISRTIKNEISSLAQKLSSADRDQSSAERALQQDLARLLKLVGSSGDGTGLLGLVSTGVAQTSASAHSLYVTSAQGGSFRNVQTQARQGLLLNSEQLRRGILYAEQIGAFGGSGTADLKVYTYSVKEG